jgi:cytochrome c556
MRVKVCVFALAALLSMSAVAVADEATDEYQPLMKPGAAANVTLQKVVQTDLAAAAQAASELQAAFAKIEAYWTQRNTADAIAAAKGVQAVAQEVHDAAMAGDKDAAVAAAKKIGANCGSCHMAHRVRLPDGSFQLKP